MKVTLEKKEKNQVQLEVEVDPQQVARAYERAYRQLSHRVNIPGFRKGKAPRQLVERTLGKDAIRQEALEHLIPEAYENAVEDQKLEPIAQPKIELGDTTEHAFEGTGNLTFKALIEVRPEVQLGAYKGVELDVPETPVTDEEVQQQLDQARQTRAPLEAVDRPIQQGDVAVVDFEGSVGGEPIENGSAKDFTLEVTPGRFIEGFTEALVGLKAGESKDAELKFPDDYPQKELAGKPATFHLSVKEVKERKLPELSDEFATGLGFESMDAMRTKIRESIAERKDEQRQIELRRQLLDKIIEQVQVEIPQSMIDREIQFLINQQAHQLHNQGLDPNKIFTAENIGEWKEKTRPEAEKRIKTSLTLGAIARAEGIQVSPEEVESELSEYAAAYRTPVAQFRDQVVKNGSYGAIADEVLSGKIIEWLMEQAKIQGVQPSEPVKA